MSSVETIAAIATPSGRGGVGIVRISGPLARPISIAMLATKLEPRLATLLNFTHDEVVIDKGIALFFQAPASFTGEDILELHGHGGPVVMDMLLAAVLSHGARLARPGEFSERAFLNDKIDLAQAEAIADLIDSHSQQAARSALRSLQGEFSKKINHLVQDLINLRTYIESAIDFSDEDIDFIADGQVKDRLYQIQLEITAVLRQTQQGVLLREGMNVVIAGPPNAGKSSLMNRLAAKETAIVTPQAGTTRDILREQIVIDGLMLNILDTAGLRESRDPVEKIGIKRAKEEIKKADLVLLVFDDTCYDAAVCDEMINQLVSYSEVIIVRNKIDLSGATEKCQTVNSKIEIFISATESLGLDVLIEQLKRCAGYRPGSEDSFIARRRHLEALECASKHLVNGSDQINAANASELLAEDLRLAQQALSQITGEFTSDDLLGNIFSNFCIGK